jgi:hypothetical protein
MSSPEQYPNLSLPAASPVWSLTVSWNPRSGLVNGHYLRLVGDAGVQLLAGCRMLAALVAAAALELALPGVPFLGGAPWPLLASVTAVFVLSSSYPRLLTCALLAGLLHDLHSPSVPFGSTALIMLTCATLAREFLDRGGRGIVGHQYMVGGFMTVVSMVAGHVVLAASFPHGEASFPFVLGRAFGSGLVAAVAVVPVLVPLKFAAGRLAAWLGGMATAFLCWFGSVLVSRLRVSDNESGPMPGSPVPA